MVYVLHAARESAGVPSLSAADPDVAYPFDSAKRSSRLGQDWTVTAAVIVKVRGAGDVPFEPGGVRCSWGLAVLTITDECIRIEARPRWLWPLYMLLFAQRRGEAAWSRSWGDAPTVFVTTGGIAMTSKDADIPMRFGASNTRLTQITQALERLGVRIEKVPRRRDVLQATKTQQ